MALEGTIKEFGLADIFQLIGLQSKTGILFLKGETETINVHFEDGNIVKVDESKRRPHLLLGQILVRKGKVTQSQVREAIEAQKTTGQKIGNTLLSQGLINKDVLRDTLTFQMNEAVYSVFRWKGGDYKFDQERVDYDRDTIVPVSTEHILMDGVRQLDEWPMVEKNMPDVTEVFRRKEGIMLPSEVSDEDREKDIFSSGGDYPITPEVEAVLKHFDGHKTVMEVIEGSAIGEFDTCRVIVDLIRNEIILKSSGKPQPVAYETHEEVAVEPVISKRAPGTIPAYFPILAYVFFVAAIAILVLQLTGSRKIMDLSEGGIESLKHPFALNIVKKVEHSSLVFLYDYGVYPESTKNLEQLDYIRSADLKDPWGSEIRFEFDDEGNLYSVSAGRDRVLGSTDDLLSSHENNKH